MLQSRWNATLEKLGSFKSVVTDEVVKRSHVSADEEHFEGEDLPEIDGAEAVKGSAEAAPEQSVWGKIKGWFG